MEKRPVPGYEEQYYLDPETMQVVNKKTGRSLKVGSDKNGYPEVKLCKNNVETHKSLHRLFAEVYIPNPDNLPDVNHKDETRTNYSLDNLEWCTEKYNQNYGTVNQRRGQKISEAKKGIPQPWVAELKGKPVIGKNVITGEEVYFPSANAANRAMGLADGGVEKALRGKQKTAGGHTWRRP